MRFTCLKVFDTPKYHCRIIKQSLEELPAGEVTIQVQYSSVNYKDALAVTGKGKILKSFPMTPGIDAAGIVDQSTSDEFKKGDLVIVTGNNLGEAMDGGYGEYIRVPLGSVIKLPQALTLRQAMIYGTAGFTAALALHRMEVNGTEPGKGPIVITGASGGVGSFAVSFFANKGYEVIAISGKKDKYDWLKQLGASEVMTLEDLNLGDHPLEQARFHGAIDNIGGRALSGLLSHVSIYGNVASIGLAASAQLSTTVMPFILRGVSLLGISSNNCSHMLRQQLWQRLATDLHPKDLELFIGIDLTLEDVQAYSRQMLERKTHGRAIVKMAD